MKRSVVLSMVFSLFSLYLFAHGWGIAKRPPSRSRLIHSDVLSLEGGIEIASVLTCLSARDDLYDGLSVFGGDRAAIHLVLQFFGSDFTCRDLVG